MMDERNLQNHWVGDKEGVMWLLSLYNFKKIDPGKKFF